MKIHAFVVPLHKIDKMKRTLKYVFVTAAMLALVSCGSKKQDETIISTKQAEMNKPKGIQKMQEFKAHKSIKWLGADYTYDINRTVDQELPVVTLEDGQKYYDNHIDLTIMRGSEEFFKKTFSKSTFNDYIDDNFRQHGILEGLVFDRIEGESMLFAASVSFPMTDEYIPLLVKISSSGTMSISKDTSLDTSSEEEEEN